MKYFFLVVITFLALSHCWAKVPLFTKTISTSGDPNAQVDSDLEELVVKLGGDLLQTFDIGPFRRQDGLGIEQFADVNQQNYQEFIKMITDGSGNGEIHNWVNFPEVSLGGGGAVGRESYLFRDIQSDYEDLKGFTVTGIGAKVATWDIKLVEYYSPGGYYYTESEGNIVVQITYYGHKIPELWMENNKLNWSAYHPHVFRIQRSVNLVDWDFISPPIDGDNTVVETSIETTSNDKYFYRVKLLEETTANQSE